MAAMGWSAVLIVVFPDYYHLLSRALTRTVDLSLLFLTITKTNVATADTTKTAPITIPAMAATDSSQSE